MDFAKRHNGNKVTLLMEWEFFLTIQNQVRVKGRSEEKRGKKEKTKQEQKSVAVLFPLFGLVPT